MGGKYAEVSDITALGRTLSEAQREGAEILLEAASSKLRLIAYKYGKRLDDMIADPVIGEDCAKAVKSVIIQSVIRAMDSLGEQSQAVSQGSQSAMGYSVTMTYLNAGQSLYFLKNELKGLGIIRQTYGGLEVYGNDNHDKGN